MDYMDSVRETFHAEAKIIESLCDTVQPAQVDAVIDALLNLRGKVILSGCGTSGTAAMKIEHTLSCVGCPAFFLSPSNALHGGLGVVEETDLVVLISRGGYTDELNQMIPACKARRARILAVTANPDSEIAKASDLLLEVKVDREPDDHNILATGSTLAVIAAFDAIAIAITKIRGFSESKFLTIHPAGEMGKRLAEEAKD